MFGNFIEDKWGDDNGNTIYAILQDRVAPDIAELWTPVRVIPETVGQYTGLTDKNGKKIFEGDIVECKWFNAMVRIEHRKHLIIFSAGSFCAEWYIGQDNYHNDLHNTFDIKVIGTIYDNPELLEVKK